MQNSKGYVESPEYLPALGLIIKLLKSLLLLLEVNLIPSSLDYKTFYNTNTYQADHFNLLACVHG